MRILSQGEPLLITSNRNLYIGYGPFPVTVTTRTTTLLVGNPYKPLFATVTRKVPHPTYISLRAKTQIETGYVWLVIYDMGSSGDFLTANWGIHYIYIYLSFLQSFAAWCFQNREQIQPQLTNTGEGWKTIIQLGCIWNTKLKNCLYQLVQGDFFRQQYLAIEKPWSSFTEKNTFLVATTIPNLHICQTILIENSVAAMIA